MYVYRPTSGSRLKHCKEGNIRQVNHAWEASLRKVNHAWEASLVAAILMIYSTTRAPIHAHTFTRLFTYHIHASSAKIYSGLLAWFFVPM